MVKYWGKIEQVVWIEDDEERMITHIFKLSIKGGMSIDIDYLIVKDMCKRYKLDAISVYEVVKAMSSEVAKK